MALKDFLQEARDLYYDGVININSQTAALSKLDLKLLDKSLLEISKELITISNKTSAATEEALDHYTNLLNILEDKIEYISDMSDVFNYINTYFDRRAVRDFVIFNLRTITNSTYDEYQKGLTLENIKYLYNCTKTIEGNVITFYNTNNSSHSGLYLSSKVLDLLDITQITIRKADGTVLEVDINYNNTDFTYIKHELLVSSQTNITFKLKSNPDEKIDDTILNTINLSLIDKNYQTEAIYVLDRTTIKADDLLSYIVSANIPTNTYLNIESNLELLDINDNVIDSINITLPVNNSEVCKRLDRVNWGEVELVTSLIVNNKRSRVKKLTREYLENLDFKNERYITYIPKNLDSNILNKYIKKLGNTSFKVNTNVVKNIILNPCIELYSFNPNESPLVSSITGVTKYETI